MARAGRSGEAGIRKRKRNSSAHERPPKVARMEEGGTCGLSLGDVEKILEVLEESDSLGLLDRVFPTQAQSSSLRSLLAHGHQHSLRVLTSAIHNLRPLPAHPRSRPSETAAQQRDFCELALSLLDQASRHRPLDSNPFDLFDHQKEPDLSLSTHRYALVQHLPSADYWSSLNSERPSSPSLLLKDLPTAHAELVSILPTPSSFHSSKPVPTLGSYKSTKSHTPKSLPAQRRLTAGSFLDYGPWAAFAPSFDHDGELVGRRELGDVLWYKRERKAQNEAQLREWIEGRGSVMDVDDEIPHRTVPEPIDVQAEFDGVLPPEVIHNLKAALDNAELENLIDELLTRNRRALVRLQELQINRLSKQGASSTVDETSEEWQTANGILESLETLSSLRPRASCNGDFLSIIPPPSVLRKLHKSLALEPHPGWHGTLPENRATALRDDSTVKVRAASAVPAQAAATAATAASTSSSPAPTSVTPVASAAVPTTTPYAGYSYAYATQQAQAYRSAAGAVATTAYTPYKTGATSYYQNYIQNAQAQPQYYGQQAYGAGATSQQPYAAYSSWFAHAQQYAASAAAANSAATAAANAGPGTPQPGTPATAATTAAYGYYPPTAAGQQQQQKPATQGTTTPAVANTAAMNRTASNGGGVSLPGVWGGYAMGQQPTLPARAAATTAAPTPVATNGMYQSTPTPQNYYGAYQAPQQSTASK